MQLRLVVERCLRVVLLTVLAFILLLSLLSRIRPWLEEEEPQYSYFYRWHREKASTEMWQVTSRRPFNPGAVSRMTSYIYVRGFERTHAELCPDRGAGLLVMIFVTSSPTHAAQRHAIRLTWKHTVKRYGFAFAFLLGQPPANLRKALADEDKMFGDLVIGNFVDSYRNLTLKTLSMLEWSAAYCASAEFLLKTDDDVFINARQLQAAAAALRRRGGMGGRLLLARSPVRDERSHYHVSEREYPAATYPAYLEGPAYLVPGRAAPALLQEALRVPLLSMEDVFVTGVVARRAGLQRTPLRRFLLVQVPWLHLPRPGVPGAHLLPLPCALRRHVAVHSLLPPEQHEIFYRLAQTPCERWPRRYAPPS